MESQTGTIGWKFEGGESLLARGTVSCVDNDGGAVQVALGGVTAHLRRRSSAMACSISRCSDRRIAICSEKKQQRAHGGRNGDHTGGRGALRNDSNKSAPVFFATRLENDMEGDLRDGSADLRLELGVHGRGLPQLPLDLARGNRALLCVRGGRGRKRNEDVRSATREREKEREGGWRQAADGSEQ